MPKLPKGKKGLRAKLRREKALATGEIKRAMAAASQAIDRLTQETQALQRIIIAERAQLIFYTEIALKYARREMLDVAVPNWMAQADQVKESFIKRAVEELSAGAAIVPHDAVATEAQAGAADVGRRIRLAE